jgi:hypothetical protein
LREGQKKPREDPGNQQIKVREVGNMPSQRSQRHDYRKHAKIFRQANKVKLKPM